MTACWDLAPVKSIEQGNANKADRTSLVCELMCLTWDKNAVASHRSREHTGKHGGMVDNQQPKGVQRKALESTTAGQRSTAQQNTSQHSMLAFGTAFTLGMGTLLSLCCT